MIIKIFDIFIKLMGLLWFFNCSTKFLLCPALLVFGSSFFHTPPVKLPLLLPSSVRGVLFPFATSFIWPKRVRDTRSAYSIALFSICSDGGRSQEEPLRGTRLFRRPFLPASAPEMSLRSEPVPAARPEVKHMKWSGWMEMTLSCDLNPAITAFQGQMCFTPTSCWKVFCLAFAAFPRIWLIWLVSAFGFLHILLSLKYLFSPSWFLLI